jgi:hypothetical protein
LVSLEAVPPVLGAGAWAEVSPAGAVLVAPVLVAPPLALVGALDEAVGSP